MSDLPQVLREMIRVDHAGEYGARRIYKGQLAVLGNTEAAADLRHMAAQEDEHYQKFNKLMIENNIRPTVMEPLWHIAGYAMGALTALMGEKAAHACTIAVEETIEEHYNDQLRKLGQIPAHQQPEGLRALIEHCNADEVAHKELAAEKGGREAPGYEILSAAIKAASRLAIAISKKV